MATYVPTNWKTGDVITATKLNNMETGIADIAENTLSKSESDTIQAGVQNQIADINGYIGYTDDDIYGVEADFANNQFTRLAAAVGLEAGSDFDSIECFGGRKRCNVTNDGVVVAYYGDAGFSATGKLTQAIDIGEQNYPIGTAVQVMVEQPKFYYKVVPLSVENVENGQIVRKARYYISPTAKAGFKVHPAFLSGETELDKIYLSAFEGCLWDASANDYILDDAQVADFSAAVGTGDMMSSIANAKPMSGTTQQLTRPNARILAQNRGSGWNQSFAATVSASEMLMIVEYASFNMQTSIGAGVSNLASGTGNESVNTGSTLSLGNESGSVSSTGCVSYRGEENFWGNIWTWTDGLNIQNPSDWTIGTTPDDKYGNLFYSNSDFADDTSESPYQDTNLHPCYGTGYISAFCYSENCDWMFMPGELSGNSSLPVGDYFWNNYSGWRVAILGGRWYGGSICGGFCWSLNYASSDRHRTVGGRLVYVPQAA